DDAALHASPPRHLDAVPPVLHTSRSAETLSSPLAGRRRSAGAPLALAGTSSSPAMRQRRLAAAIERHVADAFFSVHCEGVEEPVYISEVMERSTVRRTWTRTRIRTPGPTPPPLGAPRTTPPIRAA